MTLIEWLIGALIFAFVASVVMALTAVARAGAERHVHSRLSALKSVEDIKLRTTAVRERYLRQLPPIERALEQLPGIERLGLLGVQAGRTEPAYRVALLSLILAVIGATLGSLLLKNPAATFAGAVLLGVVPVLKLLLDRRKRLKAFEDQLPDALDLMSRSLRAGNPLLESIKFISEEMPAPLGTEFGLTWTYINYGVSLDTALRDLVERAPSISLRTLITAILVQRETGGNLAEILDRISGTLRARARFRRRLKTLTAEGRMSAVALVLVPFVLAGALSVLSPTYLPILLNDPIGKKMLVGAAFLMMLGIYWISRIINLRV
jgi:tight adherence protein B